MINDDEYYDDDDDDDDDEDDEFRLSCSSCPSVFCQKKKSAGGTVVIEFAPCGRPALRKCPQLV